MTITLNNIGNAPFYYNWTIKLYIVDFNKSIKYEKETQRGYGKHVRRNSEKET